MKTATVDAGEFCTALKKVSGVLKACPVPEIEQIHVDCRDGICRLTGTDISVWMVSEIPTGGDDFSFVFSNTKAIVRACRHYLGSLTLELSDEENDLRLTMRCGDKEGTFPVMKSSLYPEPPLVEPQRKYFTNAESLFERVKSVRYASTFSEKRPELCGVRFQGDRVWCVDGQRLAVNEDTELNVEHPFIIAASALSHLKAFGNQTVELAEGVRYLLVSAAGMKLYCRKLETSEILQLDAVLPKYNKENYEVNVLQYRKALEYLNGCAVGMREVKVVFDNGKLTLSGNGATYSAKLDVQGTCGIPYAFQLSYMKEALEQFAGEETIHIGIDSSISPIVLTGKSGNTALVLPSRMSAVQSKAA